MTDYAGFVHGGATFPLAASGQGPGGPGASLLRDADPALFFLLEYYASVLQTHLEARFLAEVAAAGIDDTITAMVAETLPLDPEPYLNEEFVNFPLLAAYRKGTKHEYLGSEKLSIDTFDVAYVLPAMQSGEAERLMPILKAVVSVLDDRTEQGMDPSYTPSSPTGSAGDQVWQRAGVARAEVKTVTYGAFRPTEKLVFPAVILSVDLYERTDFATADFQTYDGVDVHIDVNPTPDPEVLDVAQFATHVAPTLASISPTTGTKAGGTTVTLTGTNYLVGTTPTVLFGGLAATSVTVLSATSIQCKTPLHGAYDTFAADVVVTNVDGQSATLAAAYTFTTP